MKEFRVNKHITLKLENNKTNIYIDEKLFRHCKFLFLNIDEKGRKIKGNIHTPAQSIDDIEGYYDLSNAPRMDEGGIPAIVLPPEDEFWGHCSNLEVWAENKYDSLLLSRDLAFPLLRELCKVGDLIAIEQYKSEIKKRFLSHNPNVMIYLFEGLYIRNLKNEGITEILKKVNFSFLRQLAEKDAANYRKIYILILRIADYMIEFGISNGHQLLINTLVEITKNKKQLPYSVYIIENYFKRKVLNKEEQKEVLKKINLKELYQYYEEEGLSAMPDHIEDLKKILSNNK